MEGRMDDYGITIDVYDRDPSLMNIVTPFPFRDKDLIMQLPGVRYNQKEHRFLAPLSWASCVVMRGIFGDRLVVSPALDAWAREEHAARIAPALELRVALDAAGDEDLYGFQRAGVQFMAFAEQALLCDDMGLGKTVQTIRTFMELVRRGENPFPALVIAPNSMVLTWQRELDRWWPGMTVVAIPGGTPAAKRREMIMTPAHVHVISYETVRAHSRLAAYGSIRLKRCIVCDPTLADTKSNSQSRCENCRKELNRTWQTIVVDEAHRLKNPKAKQTRACWALREGSATFKIAPARYVFALTGTPIGNAPHDLWPALRLIRPREFPTRQLYIERFCRLSFNAFGPMQVVGLSPDPERRAEFYKIIDPIMRRMPKEAVLKQLPPKVYSTRYVTMAHKQAQAYRRMEKEMIAHLDGGVVVAASPLVQLTRLTQFASAHAAMENGDVRLSDPSCKIDALMEILEDMGDAPVVVFALHKQLIDLAAKRLDAAGIKYGLITGDQTAIDREIAIRDFQAGGLRAMLCTISAGGIGITLTRASTAIFLQRSWSKIDNSQAEDRIHRIGSEVHDQIDIIDIMSTETIEERQRELLFMKAERFEEVVRDRTFIRQLLGVAA